MNKELLKKLLLNSLNCLLDSLNNSSCNDLFPDDDLLKNISKKEFEEIEKTWKKLFPEESEEVGGELIFDIFLVDTIIKEVKKL